MKINRLYESRVAKKISVFHLYLYHLLIGNFSQDISTLTKQHSFWKKILVTEVAILAACANRNRLPNFSIGNPHYFLYYILNKRRLLNCKLFKSISFCTDEFFQVFQNWKMWYGLFYIFKAGRRFCILGKYLWLLLTFLVHYICCTFYKFQSSFIYYFTFNL